MNLLDMEIIKMMLVTGGSYNELEQARRVALKDMGEPPPATDNINEDYYQGDNVDAK